MRKEQTCGGSRMLQQSGVKCLFFFLEKEENGENGKRIPCFWALGCSQMSWSRALQLVSLRPSLMGSGREEAGEFS